MTFSEDERAIMRETLGPSVRLTEQERDVMRHTLGLDWSKKPYRNHFCAGPDHDEWPILQALCERGFMKHVAPHALSGGDSTFLVTDKGRAHLILWLSIQG